MVNPVLSEITVTLEASGANRRAYEAVAGAYTSVAKQLGGRAYATTALTETAAAYAGLLRQAGQTAEQYAGALGRRNAHELRAIRARATTLRQREQNMLGRLKRACHQR